MMPGKKKHYPQSLVLSSLQYHYNYDFCYDQGPHQRPQRPSYTVGTTNKRATVLPSLMGHPPRTVMPPGGRGGWGMLPWEAVPLALLSATPAHPHTSVPAPADKNVLSLSHALFLRKMCKTHSSRVPHPFRMIYQEYIIISL